MNAKKIDELDPVLKEFNDEVKDMYLGNMDDLNEVILSAKQTITDYASVEDYKRKLNMRFLKEASIMLKNNELDHRYFDLDNLKSSELWRPLAKVVLLKRIEELKNCKVQRKGKKYDVSGLKLTYLGGYIMDRLEFSNRKVLDEDEYGKIESAIKKLKFELPVVTKPTETELFFSK